MRILVASKIDPDTITTLQERHDVLCAFGASHEELLSLIPDREALVFRSGVTISRDILDAAPDLHLIVRAGSGLDNIDLAEIDRRGIRLMRIPGPAAKAVSELTFAHMLALSRNIVYADHLMRREVWAKNDLESYLLTGKTVGVVGAGNIGRRVCDMGVAWGMKAVACVDNYTEERAASFRAGGIDLIDFESVVEVADFLTIHVPLRPETRGLIDADVLARMKPSACIVNAARGGVVDEVALLDALKSGRLRGAGLDVHENEGNGKESPFRELTNVVLTPHVGSATVDTQREIGIEIIAHIEAADAEVPKSATGH